MSEGDDTLLLTGHESDLGGGFIVHRLLPSGKRQRVGPFIFFDHFGPVTHPPEANTDVRPHPHIGLATVTYLFEGAMMHRDSLGSVQRIEPGAINWMSAGRGIVHSERTPDDLRTVPRASHGLQLWVALPADQEETEPSFAHTGSEQIPEVPLDGAHVRVLVGSAWGATSPVKPNSDTLYLDIRLEPGRTLDLPALATEMAVYGVDRPLTVNGETLASHTMAVVDGAAQIRNDTDGELRFVVIGGEPLAGDRFIWWNFVSSRKERVAQAAQDWEARRFADVPGEHERIDLPVRRPHWF